MKNLKLSGLFAFMIMCSSCDFHFHHDPKFVEYYLAFTFQDASGNDLVKGIELEEWYPGNIPVEEANSGVVNRDFYALDIIVSQPCKNWDNEVYNAPARPGFIPDVNSPKLLWWKNNSLNCLGSGLSIPVDDCPVMEKLTFKLKCPYLFGDEAVHDLVTYWDTPKIRNSSVRSKCYRIEFEGKVFTDISYESIYHSIATIILDR